MKICSHWGQLRADKPIKIIGNYAKCLICKYHRAKNWTRLHTLEFAIILQSQRKTSHNSKVFRLIGNI